MEYINAQNLVPHAWFRRLSCIVTLSSQVVKLIYEVDIDVDYEVDYEDDNDATWLLLWYVDDVYVVKYNCWIICLTVLLVNLTPSA